MKKQKYCTPLKTAQKFEKRDLDAAETELVYSYVGLLAKNALDCSRILKG